MSSLSVGGFEQRDAQKELREWYDKTGCQDHTGFDLLSDEQLQEFKQILVKIRSSLVGADNICR